MTRPIMVCDHETALALGRKFFPHLLTEHAAIVVRIIMANPRTNEKQPNNHASQT